MANVNVWVPIGISFIVMIVAIMGHNLDIDEIDRQREIDTQVVVGETLELLGLQPDHTGTYKWNRPRGKFGFTPDELNKLKKVRENIVRLKVIEDDRTQYHVILQILYLIKTADFDGATQLLKSLGDMPEQQKSFLILQAMHLADYSGMEDEAFNILESVIDESPEEKMPKILYSMMLHSHDKNDEALTVLDGILERFPNDSDATDSKIHILYCTNQITKAKDLLIGFHNGGNQTFSSRFHLGAIYTSTGELNFAIDEFHKALKLNPESPELNRTLGLAYEKIGERELAEKHKGRASFYSVGKEQQGGHHYNTH